MSWAGHDAVAYAIFAPAAVAGLLAPQLLILLISMHMPMGRLGVWRPQQGREAPNPTREGVAGVALAMAAAAAALAAARLHSGFVFAMWAAAAAASLLVPAKARTLSA